MKSFAGTLFLTIITVTLARVAGAAPGNPTTAPAVPAAQGLARHLTVEYKDVKVSDVVADLQKRTGVEIRVKWDRLKNELIAPTARTSYAAHDQPLSTVLDGLFHFGGETHGFEWYVDGNAVVVTVGTLDDAANKTLRYDARAAIAQIGPGGADLLPKLITTTIVRDQWLQVLPAGQKNPEPAVDAEGVLTATGLRPLHARVEWLLAALADPAHPPAARFSVADTPARRKTLDRLAKPLGAKAGKMPLEEAVTAIQAASGLDIAVNWAQCEAIGIDRKAEASLPAAATAGEALRQVLAVTKGQFAQIDFEVDANGLVYLAPNDYFESTSQLLGVYDFRTAGGKAAAERAAKEIQTKVQPGQWTDDGGQFVIQPCGPLLVIAAPRRVHQEVARLLPPAAIPKL